MEERGAASSPAHSSRAAGEHHCLMAGDIGREMHHEGKRGEKKERSV